MVILKLCTRNDLERWIVLFVRVMEFSVGQYQTAWIADKVCELDGLAIHIILVYHDRIAKADHDWT